jgi:hypothetical protein
LSLLNHLPPKDLERLSAYADGALSARETAEVEARLETNADLRQALAELRSVKVSLADLPERRVPRNFTLREADLVRPVPRPAFPYLRFATVVAGGLFVLTTAVRSLGLPALSFASAPAAQLAAEAPVAATLQPEVELRAVAPAAGALPEETQADTLALAPTPTPAGTACPECPTSLTTEKTEASQANVEDGSAARESAVVTPLIAAQWLLGLAAVVLGALTVRARRR